MCTYIAGQEQHTRMAAADGRGGGSRTGGGGMPQGGMGESVREGMVRPMDMAWYGQYGMDGVGGGGNMYIHVYAYIYICI